MTTRLATSEKAPVTIAVDEGYAGQPQQRTTFTFDRSTGSLEKAENFKSLSAGRQLRSWLRFAHTGEIYGLTGQTVAGLVSLGSVVLVYTGLRWRFVASPAGSAAAATARTNSSGRAPLSVDRR